MHSVCSTGTHRHTSIPTTDWQSQSKLVAALWKGTRPKGQEGRKTSHCPAVQSTTSWLALNTHSGDWSHLLPPPQETHTLDSQSVRIYVCPDTAPASVLCCWFESILMAFSPSLASLMEKIVYRKTVVMKYTYEVVSLCTNILPLHTHTHTHTHTHITTMPPAY